MRNGQAVPAFEVTSKLAEREGHTCFFLVRNDALIGSQHVEKNVEVAIRGRGC